ncbi:MAG: peptidylprolyl isomerase [Chitinophagales bacterium]|nr:peptidylprolyl isomerase [Chitinophagales bacterium]MDW8418362.1 peptidylprolyl isomerase [Chitinophagales bacterium]
MLKYIYICVGAVTAVSLQAQNTVLDKVVAVVGDNIVLHSEIEGQFQQLKAQEPDIQDRERCRILDNLLLEKLFLAQAQLDSVVANPEEVEAELDRRIKYFTSIFGSVQKLEEYYGKSILQLKDDFRDDIAKQVVADKMRNKILGGIQVTPAEVREFFERIPPDSVPYFNAELELGQIVMFPKVNELEKKRAREKIEQLRKEILNGADFSYIAIRDSKDPGSAREGGSLGIVERGEMVPEFEAVIYKLKEGEVSEVFETPFGYHLAIVDEKRGDKLKVRHILITTEIYPSDLALVKKRMDSIAHQLQVDSLDWREAVNAFSEDEQSKSIGGLMTNPKTGTTYFEKADIDGTLIFTIDQMKVGEYSNPLPYSTYDPNGRPRNGYRIIWLKSETKPHKASLTTDYPKIQAAAKAEKQAKIIENWMKMHVSKNYIRIDESMLGCPEMAKWLTGRKPD